MNPIELRCRRAALGLSQAELAALLDCPRPVLSTWETGTRNPRDPLGLHIDLCELEDVLEGLVGDLVEQIEHASGVKDSPTITERTYDRDEDWWAVDAEARSARLPAALHRVALARAVTEVRDAGISVQISPR